MKNPYPDHPQDFNLPSEFWLAVNTLIFFIGLVMMIYIIRTTPFVVIFCSVISFLTGYSTAFLYCAAFRSGPHDSKTGTQP